LCVLPIEITDESGLIGLSTSPVLPQTTNVQVGLACEDTWMLACFQISAYYYWFV